MAANVFMVIAYSDWSQAADLVAASSFSRCALAKLSKLGNFLAKFSKLGNFLAKLNGIGNFLIALRKHKRCLQFEENVCCCRLPTHAAAQPCRCAGEDSHELQEKPHSSQKLGGAVATGAGGGLEVLQTVSSMA